MVIEGVARGLVWKNNDKAAHVECRCSHTEALRVNPRLPNGGSGLCTPSSSRSLTAVVIEGVARGLVWKNNDEPHTTSAGVHTQKRFGSTRAFQSVVPVYVRPLAAGA